MPLRQAEGGAPIWALSRIVRSAQDKLEISSPDHKNAPSEPGRAPPQQRPPPTPGASQASQRGAGLTLNLRDHPPPPPLASPISTGTTEVKAGHRRGIFPAGPSPPPHPRQPQAWSQEKLRAGGCPGRDRSHREVKGSMGEGTLSCFYCQMNLTLPSKPPWRAFIHAQFPVEKTETPP